MTQTATKENHAIENGKGWYADIVELLKRLENDHGDPEFREAIEQEIHEGPLSVMVRDGWRSPGGATDEGPDEYEILLSTGGPALRIYGRLGKHSEPETAELQWQDWGTLWTRCTFADQDTLLAYARNFYFGD